MRAFLCKCYGNNNTKEVRGKQSYIGKIEKESDIRISDFQSIIRISDYFEVRRKISSLFFGLLNQVLKFLYIWSFSSSENELSFRVIWADFL